MYFIRKQPSFKSYILLIINKPLTIYTAVLRLTGFTLTEPNLNCCTSKE